MRYDFLPHAYDPRLYHDPLRRPVLGYRRRLRAGDVPRLRRYLRLAGAHPAVHRRYHHPAHCRTHRREAAGAGTLPRRLAGHTGLFPDPCHNSHNGYWKSRRSIVKHPRRCRKPARVFSSTDQSQCLYGVFCHLPPFIRCISSVR